MASDHTAVQAEPESPAVEPPAAAPPLASGCGGRAGQRPASQRPGAQEAEKSPALRVLVVDDERISRETAVRQLRDACFVAAAADSGQGALERLSTQPWDVVLCDLRMPGMDGLALLRAVRRDWRDIDVIVMTAYGTVETAVEAIKDGAADFLTKPFSFQELEHRLRKLEELRGVRREVRGLRALLADDEEQCCGIVGRSPAMRELTERLRSFARHLAPVLITGETGTGKEMVSRALHQLGPRSHRPFVAVACGAIPTELAESELFGHEKGAFTGATGQRFGAFERADGGTLLLDDVDDLPLGLQVKLLRALEEGRFVRVGGSREIAVDVRVVATSKIDLDRTAAEGRFRRDLYYRLRALELRIPALRERGEDILLLAEHFVRLLAQAAGAKEVSLGPEAAACLRRYRWPGNVRELRHAMESAVIVCQGGVIGPACLPDFLRAAPDDGPDELFSVHLEGREGVPFNEAVSRFEQRLIRWAMGRSGGQQKQAAALLGLPRTTLQSKLGRREPAKSSD
ncbi:MAG: sigma-54-dependent Fis family transcriptional regulator [Deltaproteobacteria bacterium]|nr:sigma-54-dependent Fis family transcriptional regulator [Deltaproteobacteria bacterium]